MAEAMKDWQHGIELDRLKALARPFRDAYKPYSYGAFGTPNERAVAQAIHENEWHADGALEAIGGIVRTSRGQKDWTGAREFRFQQGDVFFRDSVCPSGRERALVKWMIGIAKKLSREGGIIIEIHEENKAMRSALHSAGFFHALTKIMASSDLRGLYINQASRSPRPLPDVDELTLGEIKWPFVSVKELEGIRAELGAYAPWAQHYSSYNKRQSWTAFALRGYYPRDPSNIVKPAEMNQAWKREHEADLGLAPADTSAMKKFPITQTVLDRIPGEKDRIRFSRVAGGGELTRHADITDRSAGTADGKVARLHIPIITNPSVRFIGWDERGHRLSTNMRERGLYYLDQRKPHAVQNGDGGKDRIHIMVDVFCGPELRRMIEAADPVTVEEL